MNTLLPLHRPLGVSISGGIKETLASSQRAQNLQSTLLSGDISSDVAAKDELNDTGVTQPVTGAVLAGRFP